MLIFGDYSDDSLMNAPFDPDGLNKNDGDDVIDIGDNNGGFILAFGQGGNDKIVGGFG